MVRSDARENRARILAAARQSFTEDDNASMNQIAQRAGVGPDYSPSLNGIARMLALPR